LEEFLEGFPTVPARWPSPPWKKLNNFCPANQGFAFLLLLAADASEAYKLLRIWFAMDLQRRPVPKASRDLLPNLTEVMPFGRYGAGLWTGHPIGLVIVVGLLLMGFVGLPEARWFLALTVPLGGICAFFLWLHHR
jgi:hypothetical protein